MQNLIQRLIELAYSQHDDHSVASEAVDVLQECNRGIENQRKTIAEKDEEIKKLTRKAFDRNGQNYEFWMKVAKAKGDLVKKKDEEIKQAVSAVAHIADQREEEIAQADRYRKALEEIAGDEVPSRFHPTRNTDWRKWVAQETLREETKQS